MSRVLLKKSSVINKVPVTSTTDAVNGLEYGELAINYADEKLYFRNSANAIKSFSAASGTVTSVAALTLGTTGTDVSSTVANETTTPVITLNIPTASAANRGALSATDWSTFNAKAPTASPTFTGTTTVDGVFGNIYLTTYGSIFVDGDSTNNIVQASSLARTKGGGLWSTGGNTRIYSVDAIEFRTGVTLRDQDTPTGGSTTLTIATSGNITSTGTVTANGVLLTGNTGTVTSVAALTIGTTGTDVTSTVANGTTTPVITLNIPTASATNRGALSAADWTTFNNKQPAGTYATGTGTASGTNTGDNAVNSLYSGLVSNATHTGDVTGSTVLTLATVNSNVGTWNNVTVNGKGLVTAGSNVAYLTAESDTLATVTGRGASTSTPITLTGNLSINSASLFVGRPVSDTSSIVTANTALTVSSLGVDQTSAQTNVMRLSRDGTSGVVYAGAADFDIYRHTTSGVSPNVGLVIRLSTTTTSDYYNALTLESNGTIKTGTNNIFHDGYHPNADVLTTARTIALTGDVSYTSGAFDGSSNITGVATLATVNSNVGTWNNVTVNGKGLVTAGSNVAYLTAESDTLATVTGRGATTSTTVTLSGGISSYMGDTGVLFQSYNASAANAAQLSIKHSLGDVTLTNARGALNIGIGDVTTASITLQSDYSNPLILQRGGSSGKGALIMRGADTIGVAIEHGRSQPATDWGTYLAFSVHDNNTSDALLSLKEKVRINAVGVGIGTSAPSYKLQIGAATGTAASVLSALTPVLYVDGGATANSSIVLKSHVASGVHGAIKLAVSPDSTNYSWSGMAGIADANGAATTLAFYTATGNTQGTAAGASSERMRLDGSGNLGIGTSAPAAKLHVYNRADAGAAPSTPEIRIEHQDINAVGTGGSHGGLLSFYNIQQNNTGWAADAVWGKINFWSSQPSSGVAELKASIWASSDGAIGGTTKNTYIAFATSAGTAVPAERMRITANGGIAFGGAANYGSSGQVLQSNGNAAPSWVTRVSTIAATTPIVTSAATGAITLSHAASGVTASTYNNVTVNATGHVTAGSNVAYYHSGNVPPYPAEADTLATVTGRGATTTTAVILNGGLSTGTASTGVTRAIVNTDGDFLSFYSTESNARVKLGRDVGIAGGAGLALGGALYALIASSDTNGSALYFKLNAAAGAASTSPNMTLTTTGLGIGTSAPYKLLTLSDATSMTTLGLSERLRIAPTTQVVGNRSEIGFSPYPTAYNNHVVLGTILTTTAGYCASDFYIATRELTTDTAPIERLRIIANGNVGIGTTTPGYKLQVNGSFAATTKSFLIDHPTKPGMQLRYGSLEGPENGVYIRGRLKGNKIELPEYWTKLVDPDSITVNLTPIGKSQDIYVEDIIDNVVYVGGENVNCFYTVFAERVDVEKLEVEIA